MKIFKRLISGAIALSMLLTMSSVSTFAADSYDDEAFDDVVTGDNYWESTNFVVQDFLEGMDKSSTIYEINWSSKTGHSDIAKYVNEMLSGKYPPDEKKDLCECLVYGSYIADHPDMHHDSFEIKDNGEIIGKKVPSNSFYSATKVTKYGGNYYFTDSASQLHAISKITYDNSEDRPEECGNYLLYLECLWLYAKYAGIDGYVKYTYNNSFNYVGTNLYFTYNVDKVNNKIKSDIGYSVFSKYKQMDIDQLLNTIPYVFYHYSDICIKRDRLKKLGAKFDYNKGLSNNQKRFLVLGLGLHLIGDSYAHKGIIPSHYGEKDDEFDKYFKNRKVNGEKLIIENKLPKLKKELIGGRIVGISFKNYIASDFQNKANTYYEDNPSFVPDRFSLSKKVSKRYIDEFLKNKTDFKTALNNNKIYRIDEKGSHGESIKVLKYSYYKNEL
ncbi:MAG: hypothetical protein K6C68_01195 [Ruminococcus sp.]|nr:hypothetical protein [Ruminococcus sp.]